MVFVTVQLGQCGNQIGTDFFKALSKDAFGSKSGWAQSVEDLYKESVLDRYFYQTCDNKVGGSGFHPRSVLIDMEPKVISQSMLYAKQSGMWTFSPKQCFSQKSGSGNNWSYGYIVHGQKCDRSIEDLVRYQVECCDRFDGFLCLMSLAGGTGSGLGTHVTEMLRDLYGKSFIVNQVVAPYASGEVIVQNYNSLLTLAHLYQASDGLILLENDRLHQMCSRLLSLKQVSFNHMNRVIAQKMTNLLAPAAHQLTGEDNYLGSYVENIYAHPSYKLSSLLTVPLMSEVSVQYSTFQWQPLIRTLRQMLIAKSHMEEGINWGVKVRPTSDYNRSVSNIVVCRGKDSHTLDVTSLNERTMYPTWLPNENCITSYTNQRCCSGYEKSASLLTNSQLAVDTIDRIVSKAWNMFISKAYLHQYQRYDITEEHMFDCFNIMEKVILDYKGLGGYSEH